MNKVLESISYKVDNDQHGFITHVDIINIMTETDNNADFRILVRRNLGRDIINIKDYIDFYEDVVENSSRKDDYIRDVSVGFWESHIKDTTWDVWKKSVLAS